MSARQDDVKSVIAPIAELLGAHATLARNTSDHMGLALSDTMSELQGLASGLPEEAGEEFQRSLARMMVALQSQDILRQQLDVLIQGLKALGDAAPSSNAAPISSDWVAARVEGLREAYVMREQHVLHEALTGRAAPPESEPGPMLFD
jgi:hypothetical protein